LYPIFIRAGVLPVNPFGIERIKLKYFSINYTYWRDLEENRINNKFLIC
jgi:hypothetical protein